MVLTGKQDNWNGVYGGLAGGAVLGTTLRRLPIAVGAAATLAAVSLAVDLSGNSVVGVGLSDNATPPRTIYPYPARAPVANDTVDT